MKKVKVFLLMLIFIIPFTLIGCSAQEASDLWEEYVEGINAYYNTENKTDAATKVGKTFYPDQADLDEFLKGTYFADLGATTIETKKAEVVIECDFSSELSPQAYYKLEVDALINGAEKKLELYLYTNTSGIYFCSPISLTGEKLGNEPNEIWLAQVYYETEDENLLYSISENKDYIKIIRNVGNPKEMVIPTEINGTPVTEISSYAFYRFSKILCFTFPASKLSKLTIPEGIKTIGEYAFFQCTKLEELTIPQSVDKVSSMAFTGCRGLKTVTFLRETEVILGNEELSSISYGDTETPLTIKGAYDMEEGEILILKVETEGTGSVKWSSSQSCVTVNADTGEVFASSTGDATIRVEFRDNPQVYAEVKIHISSVESKVEISNDAFNRCSSLENIYISAYNPNTLKIGGTGNPQFNLTKDVKIYVPKGSLKMYAQNKSWSAYADQLYEYEVN